MYSLYGMPNDTNVSHACMMSDLVCGCTDQEGLGEVGDKHDRPW